MLLSRSKQLIQHDQLLESQGEEQADKTECDFKGGMVRRVQRRGTQVPRLQKKGGMSFSWVMFSLCSL